MERWWSLVRVLCVNALQCAYALASVNEYVSLCLQMLNPINTPDAAQRQRVAENLQLLLNGQPPNAEPLSTGLDLAVANWQRLLAERCFFTVQMQPIYGWLL